MWQVDNDHYCLWHLEHELRQKSVDKLLNSVTVSDRSEASVLPRRWISLAADAVRDFARLIHADSRPAARADKGACLPTVTSRS